MDVLTIYKVGIIVSTLLVPSHSSSLRNTEYVQLVQYNDVMTTSDVLWTVDVPSVYSCAITCFNDNNCAAFFHGDSSCSGYDKSNPVNLTAHPGNQFYCQKDTCIDEEVITTAVPAGAENWCSGDRFVLDTVNSVCYKASETPKTWSDSDLTCTSEGARLAILDTQDKLDLVASIPDFMCSPGKLGPLINKCYTATSTARTWGDANTLDCVPLGGILASFPDNATYNLVVDGLGITNSSEIWWLGLTDVAVEGTMLTVDQQPMPWDNIVFPFGYFVWDCIVISPPNGYKWIEAECTELHRAVCEVSLQSVTTADFWIGGSDSVTEGVWKWQNGAGMDMSAWHVLQPDGGTGENCAALSYQTFANKFLDKACSETKYYICEKNV